LTGEEGECLGGHQTLESSPCSVAHKVESRLSVLA
jgi:hypothetical protein